MSKNSGTASLVITGTGFRAGLTVSDSKGIFTFGTPTVTADQITVAATPNKGQTGVSDLIVTNPGGASVTSSSSLKIT